MVLNLRSDFARRVLSALILVPVCVGAILIGHLLFDALVALLCALMAREWSHIIIPHSSNRLFRLAYSFLLALPVFISSHISPATCVYFSIGIALGFGMASYSMGKKQAIWLFVGVIAISMMGISLQWLRDLPGVGHYIVLMLFVTIWAIDTAAFFGGRLIGGLKLAPKISPNKTWAGLFVGVAAGSLVVPLFYLMGLQWFPPLLNHGSLTVSILLFSGGILAVLAQMGDLIESYLKRQFGVKDSGTLIPGHGGILDRVDSFLVTAPILALILWALHRGQWGF